ncbi:hypothetical protein ACFYXL_22430 [Streptomyces tsukubensis]|uniref:hypothetical protein n=1 Tax=Streptomyces tsukubensis TaxID=83656 RepID=UPI0036D00F13
MSTAAKITLYLSPEDGLVALPAGPGSDWARTVLDLAGFEELHEGIHALALSDQETARRAVDTLHLTADRFGVRLDTSDHPFIGDAARHVARGLPGTWDLEMGNLRLDESDARGRLARAWSSPGSPLATATGSYLREMPAAAFLSDRAGRELVLADAPWNRGSIVVGAIAPHLGFLALDVHRPTSVAALTVPSALQQITRELLPSYDRALVEGHRRMLDTVLNGIREAQASGKRPDLLPLAVGVQEHVPYLIQHVRTAGTRQLSEQSTTALNRAEEMLGAGIPTDEQETARVLKGWLDHGTRIANMIDTLDPYLADPPAPADTARGLPPAPPGPAAGPRPRR